MSLKYLNHLFNSFRCCWFVCSLCGSRQELADGSVLLPAPVQRRVAAPRAGRGVAIVGVAVPTRAAAALRVAAPPRAPALRLAQVAGARIEVGVLCVPGPGVQGGWMGWSMESLISVLHSIYIGDTKYVKKV